MIEPSLNYAPCGYLSLNMNGMIQTVNHTLLDMLKFTEESLEGQHLNKILSVPAQLFYQFYFVPLIRKNGSVEEIYFSLVDREGNEIPVLFNAKIVENDEKHISCIMIPIKKRNDYENELLIARKRAETALNLKEQANADLEDALERIEKKQMQLMELNRENQQYKSRTEIELKLAKRIQETSLSEPINNDEVRMEIYYQPSTELSGDIYGFYQIGEHKYGLIILDVMGHGISSAMITMSIRTIFETYISLGYEPHQVLERLDLYLHELFSNDEDARHYCTGICLQIDVAEKTIHYSNAGHPPALWQASDGTINQLFSTSPPIGLLEGIEFKTKSFSFEGKGKLLLYTDGVDPLGTNHLQTLVTAYENLTIEQLKEKIIHSVKEEEKAAISDDQCFILLEIL